MTTEPREPSRVPVRGTIAAAGTVGALTLLLSFQGGPLAPSEPVTAADDEALPTDELASAETTTDSVAETTIGPVTYTGDAFATRWGDVQVEVTLEGADITEVVATEMPASDNHTMAISEEVAPILREEAISSDSAAGLSVISGATYTSEAYADSLQSALDQADQAAADVSVASEPEPGSEVVEESAEEARTATGDAVAIRWGDVQVAVTVEGQDIVDVETIDIPMGDRKSQRINDNAEPVLREAAIAADSADISVVSGATYTSEAYAQSLQSALDRLGI